MSEAPDRRPATSPPQSHRPSGLLRLLRALTITLGAWLLLSNVWLNTLAPSHLSGQRFVVDWSSAWMLLPGHLRTRGLDLQVDGRRDQWHLGAKRARLDVRLAALLERRFELTSGQASGVSYRMRRKPTVAPEAADFDDLGLPPIGGLQWTVREPQTTQRRPPWRILLSDLHLEGVHDVWIDRLRLQPGSGSGSLGAIRGHADFRLRQSMELRGIEVRLRDAKLSAGGRPWIDQLRTTAHVDLEPIALRALRDPQSLSALSAAVTLGGSVQRLDFLRTLAPASQLDLSGHGTVHAEIQLVRGIPEAGSSLTVNGNDLSVQAAGLEASGAGRIEATIDSVAGRALSAEQILEPERRLTLRVGLAGLELGGGPIERFGARAESLDLVLTGRQPTLLAPPRDPRLHLELPHFEIPDISTFQSFLPPAAGWTLLGGRAVLKTRIDLDGNSETARFELSAEEARLRFRGTEIAGALHLTGRTDGLLARRTTQVSGLQLSLEGTSNAGPRRAAQPLRVTLRSPGLEVILPEAGQKPSQAFRLADQTLHLEGTIDALGAWWAGRIPLLPQLDQPIDLRARLAVQDSGAGTARIDDLRVDLHATDVAFEDLAEFQPLIPPASQFELESGAGTLAIHLIVERGRETAAFQLSSETARASLRGTALAGQVGVSGRAWHDQKLGRIQVSDVTVDYRGTSAPEGEDASPLEARLRLDDLSLELPEGDGPKARWHDQTVHIVGSLSELGSWSLPLARVPWIRIDGGATIEAVARLSSELRGLDEGSSIDLRAPDLAVNLAGWQTRADAHLGGRLLLTEDGRRLQAFDLTLQDAQLRKEGRPALSLPRLSLELQRPAEPGDRPTSSGASRGPGTGPWRDLWLRMEADPSEPLDVIALNSYLPTEHLRLANGTASIQGDLRIEHGRAAARLALESRQLRIGLNRRSARAAANLDLDLRSSDPTLDQFEIERGELRLAEVLFSNVQEHDGGWWAIADLESGLVRTSPLHFETRAELRMRDTEPIVHLLGESFRAVHWLAPLLDIRDVDGTATIVLDRNGLRLEDLQIEGSGGLRVRGEVELQEPGRALLLISLHHLHAGFEKQGDDHEVKLLRPTRWFERRLERWRREG